jgi:hypothetical protein
MVSRRKEFDRYRLSLEIVLTVKTFAKETVFFKERS